MTVLLVVLGLFFVYLIVSQYLQPVVQEGLVTLKDKEALFSYGKPEYRYVTLKKSKTAGMLEIVRKYPKNEKERKYIIDVNPVDLKPVSDKGKLTIDPDDVAAANTGGTKTPDTTTGGTKTPDTTTGGTKTPDTTGGTKTPPTTGGTKTPPPTDSTSAVLAKNIIVIN
jgi:hypothetical protein